MSDPIKVIIGETTRVIVKTSPAGLPGPSGQPSSLSVGTVTTLGIGEDATVEITGDAPDQVIDFGIPQGPQGATGNSGTITVGTVTTGSAGTSVIVTNVGTPTAAILNFTIPVGATGGTGSTGAAATITLGTVTTGAAGTSVIITNSGTSGAAVFNFTIPRGDTGATGNTGATGPAYNPTWRAVSSSDTLATTDLDNGIRYTGGSAGTLTIGSGTFTAGKTLVIFQEGAGQVTVAAGSKTMYAPNGFKIAGQYRAIVLFFTANDVFFVSGDSV